MLRMADPALHAWIEVVPIHPVLGIRLCKSAQLAGEAMAVVVAQSPAVRIHQITQQIQTVASACDVRLARVQPQPLVVQPLRSRRSSGGSMRFITA